MVRRVKLGNTGRSRVLLRDQTGETDGRSCHTSASRGISLISRPPATSEHSKNIRRDTQKEAGLRHRGAIWKCLPSVGGHLSPDSISGSLFSPCLAVPPRLFFSRPLFLALPPRLTTLALNPRGFAHMSTIYFLPAHKSFSG